MRISDWSSDVCSSDLATAVREVVDLYDIDYDALATYDPSGPFASDSQKQLGIYIQDKIRFYDRVALVLGARRDRVTFSTGKKDNATTFRAGIIGEIGVGFSPSFSYTERFLKSEEETYEFQSLMRTSYAVYSEKKNNI